MEFYEKLSPEERALLRYESVAFSTSLEEGMEKAAEKYFLKAAELREKLKLANSNPVNRLTPQAS